MPLLDDRVMKTYSVCPALVILLVLCLTGESTATEYKVGSIQIGNPWSRATPKGARIGAGYMTIKNTGAEADRLVSGTTDVATGVQIHEMTMDQGVAKMREMKDGIEIKPGDTVELKPGSPHIMFVNLKRRLEQGERVNRTLRFQRAGSVEIEYPVEAIGAKASEQGGDHMHQH
jgi:periplasmic copper chaperone A